MSNNKEIIKGYADAVWNGDLGDARSYLHDTEVVFQGVLAQYDGADAADQVIENVKGFRAMVKEVRFVSEMFDENGGVLLYDVVTQSPAGTLRMAEFFDVRQGKITGIKLVFDATELRKMM